jgi:hypothetical protein
MSYIGFRVSAAKCMSESTEGISWRGVKNARDTHGRHDFILSAFVTKVLKLNIKLPHKNYSAIKEINEKRRK